MSDPRPLDIDFEFGPDLSIIGTYYVEHRAASIVTGRYKFTNDHQMTNKLYGRILGSPHAHAKILSIDTSKAEDLEGVEAVITYQDNPNWSDTMLSWGQEVAAVAAVDEYTAERALLLIEVEYDVLPFNITAEDAMKSGAPLTGTFEDTNIGSPSINTRGDVEAGFAEADVVIEETEGWGRPHTQNHIETEGALAWWDGEDVYGYDSNQSPHSNNRGNASSLGLPLNRCHFAVIGTGGGFGGRGQSREPTTAALLSKKAGKPVQLIRPRRIQTPSRRNHYGPRLTMKIGCKNDGTLTAIQTTWYIWAGRNASGGGFWQNQDTTFDCPNLLYTRYGVATNTGIAGGYRCLGHPETAWLMDIVLYKMAARLGMNPLEFLRKIFIKDYGIQQDTGQPLGSPISLRAALEKAVEVSGFEEKYHEPGTKTLPDGRLHGIGIHAHLDRHGQTTGGRGAIINMRRDGTALLTVGCSACHGGPHSLAAIAAETLGITYDAIQVGDWGNTDTSMDGGGQSGSNSTSNNGAAAQMAALDVRQQLFDYVADELGINPEDLHAREGKIFVKADPTQFMTHADVMGDISKPIIGTGTSYRMNLRKPVGDFPVGTAAWHRTGCAGVYELAVDPETGEVEILNMVNVCDAGRVIDRHSAEGQSMSGLWVQAGCKARYFDVKYDPVTGVKLDQTLIDNKMPTSMDLDETKDTTILLETIGAIGPFGCNGIGEPSSVPNYAAYFNALSNALGVWINERPITPQKILKILGKA